MNKLEKIVAGILIAGSAFAGSFAGNVFVESCRKNETAKVQKELQKEHERELESKVTARQIEERLLHDADYYFPLAEKIERYGDSWSGAMGYKITFYDGWTGAKCTKYLDYNKKIEEKYASMLPPLE